MISLYSKNEALLGIAYYALKTICYLLNHNDNSFLRRRSEMVRYDM